MVYLKQYELFLERQFGFQQVRGTKNQSLLIYLEVANWVDEQKW